MITPINNFLRLFFTSIDDFIYVVHKKFGWDERFQREVAFQKLVFAFLNSPKQQEA